MLRYYITEGDDVVHILYNLDVLVQEKRLACVLILRLCQCCLGLLTQSHHLLQITCVHSAHV